MMERIHELTAGADDAMTAAANGDWRERLARFGLLGKGVLHIVVGILAFQLAIGSKRTTEAAGKAGAIDWIGELPAGTALLWVLALSLFALAIWRGVTVFSGDPVEEDDAPHRVAWGFKAVIYGGLGVAALSAAWSGTKASSGSGPGGEQAADTIAGLPGGSLILFGIGIGAIALAAYLVYEHAVKAGFVDRLTVGKNDKAATFGRVGYGLRSIAYALVGVLFLQAGMSGDEDKAVGVAGALAEAAHASWGLPFLLLVAVGFASYGVYCLFESKYRKTA